MWIDAPHVLPYQGSKRKLAGKILDCFPSKVGCLFEPFVGSAAVSLAAAANGLTDRIVLADKLEPLARLWTMVIENPRVLIKEYEKHWNKQHSDPQAYFASVREDYNKTQSASALLYLVARCVKNSIRFNSKGEFNQGPDNRRLGLRPEKLAREVERAHHLLKRIATAECGDFREVLREATPDDLVYMDPPYQGTSGKHNPRYAFLLDLDELIEELNQLNKRKVPFILSFDGACGERKYGQELPDYLQLERVELFAGRSTQATLLGRDEITVESLYLSKPLVKKVGTQSAKQKPRYAGSQLAFEVMAAG
jgi:DNA adenine methylase